MSRRPTSKTFGKKRFSYYWTFSTKTKANKAKKKLKQKGFLVRVLSRADGKFEVWRAFST